MKAPDFAYLRPDTLDGVFAALARHGEDARILAGGQTLMALQNMRLAAADVLVDINRVPGLSEITETQDHLVIGALVRYAAVAEAPLVRQHAPLLADRNRSAWPTGFQANSVGYKSVCRYLTDEPSDRRGTEKDRPKPKSGISVCGFVTTGVNR